VKSSKLIYVFGERKKPSILEKNLSEQSREATNKPANNFFL